MINLALVGSSSRRDRADVFNCPDSLQEPLPHGRCAHPGPAAAGDDAPVCARWVYEFFPVAGMHRALRRINIGQEANRLDLQRDKSMQPWPRRRRLWNLVALPLFFVAVWNAVLWNHRPINVATYESLCIPGTHVDDPASQQCAQCSSQN